MSVHIRSATAADQSTIKTIIRTAGINPFSLDWPRFLIAEENGQIVGVGQIKPHKDGSRELASIAVLPERQGQGIGSQIIYALLAREKGVLYLFCRDALEGYYTRFGFQTVERAQLPWELARIHRLGSSFAALGARLSGHKMHLIVMRREGTNQDWVSSHNQNG
jgi:N-acetylglutamate synthase-like GNAT family acetyltransferase